MQQDAQNEAYPLLIDSVDTLARFIVNGWVVDGRSGGLVRGRLHSEGHILMIQPTNVLGRYEFVGYMEGGEYLMSVDATATHFNRLHEINSDKASTEVQLPQCVAGRVIDTRAEPHDKLLLISRQFVINRNSTRKYFHELESLNAPHPFYNGRIFTNEELDVIRSQ